MSKPKINNIIPWHSMTCVCTICRGQAKPMQGNKLKNYLKKRGNK